jgi:hypothetical protein
MLIRPTWRAGGTLIDSGASFVLHEIFPMTPEQCFAAILTHSPIDRMDFWFSSVHVSYAQFRLIGDCLLFGNITVKESTSKERDGADMRYKGKQFLIPPSFRQSNYAESRDKAVVVHEAVHGIIDVQKIKVTQMSGEGAGYVAQVLYRMLSGAVFDKDQSDSIAGVFGKCREIITNAGLDRGPGVVPLDACNELRVMIQHHP